MSEMIVAQTKAAHLIGSHQRTNQPMWLVGIDEQRFNPPMLVEAVAPATDLLLPGFVDFAVWMKGHRAHQMTGIIVHPEATVHVTFDPKDNR